MLKRLASETNETMSKGLAHIPEESELGRKMD